MKRPDANKARGERRVDARAKVRKVGRIITDDPLRILSCIILDLSTTGALVLVHDKVPDEFGLFYAAKRTLYPKVTVVRRLPDAIGLRFDAEPEILEPDDHRLYALKA